MGTMKMMRTMYRCSRRMECLGAVGQCLGAVGHSRRAELGATARAEDTSKWGMLPHCRASIENVAPSARHNFRSPGTPAQNSAAGAV